MDNWLENAVRTVCGAVLGGVLWALGGWQEAMWVLLALQVLDVLSGLVRAAAQHDLDSQEMWRGGARKAMVWLIMAAAALADRAVLHTDYVVRNLVVLFYCGAEGLSILENAAATGLRIPEQLREALRQFNLEGKETPGGPGASA